MKKRTLSEFMCIEMLYDYKMGKLDALRSQAVEECLQSSPRAREELKKLSLGLVYAEKLKGIKISIPLTEAIASHPKPTEKWIRRVGVKNLPQPVKWGLEAAVVALAIALFVTQMPELFKGQGKTLEVRKIEIEVASREEDSKDSVVLAKSEDVKAIEPQKAPVLAEGTSIKKPDVSIQNSNSVAINLKNNSSPEKETASDSVVQPAPQKAVKKQGYVYRLVMFVDNVDQVTPQIVQLLETNGGKKAGEVELGWRRKGGSYFHFTIPKANYDVVTEGLKKYSDFNIVKSEHPRVMPEDTERYILWVEERK